LLEWFLFVVAGWVGGVVVVVVVVGWWWWWWWLKEEEDYTTRYIQTAVTRRCICFTLFDKGSLTIFGFGE